VSDPDKDKEDEKDKMDTEEEASVDQMTTVSTENVLDGGDDDNATSSSDVSKKAETESKQVWSTFNGSNFGSAPFQIFDIISRNSQFYQYWCNAMLKFKTS